MVMEILLVSLANLLKRCKTLTLVLCMLKMVMEILLVSYTILLKRCKTLTPVDCVQTLIIEIVYGMSPLHFHETVPGHRVVCDAVQSLDDIHY